MNDFDFSVNEANKKLLIKTIIAKASPKAIEQIIFDLLKLCSYRYQENDIINILLDDKFVSNNTLYKDSINIDILRTFISYEINTNIRTCIKESVEITDINPTFKYFIISYKYIYNDNNKTYNDTYLMRFDEYGKYVKENN